MQIEFLIIIETKQNNIKTNNIRQNIKHGLFLNKMAMLLRICNIEVKKVVSAKLLSTTAEKRLSASLLLLMHSF